MPVTWSFITALLGIFLVISAVFLSASSYSRTEIVKGVIEPDLGIVQVAATKAGWIDQVLVHEGQDVHVGERLARIRENDVDWMGDRTSGSLLAAITRESVSIEAQRASGQAAASSEQAAISAQLVGLRAQLVSVEAQIVAQKQLVQIAQEDLAAAQAIAGRGFVSKRDLMTRTAAVLSKQQELAVLTQNRAATIASIAQAANSARQSVDKSNAAMAVLSASQSQIDKERALAGVDQGYFLISPSDGRVSSMSAKVGQLVMAPNALIAIVPLGSKLVARFDIPERAIGYLKPGASARLVLDAYPAERFGTLDASLLSVTSIPAFDSTGEARPATYRGIALIKHPYLVSGQNIFPVLSGMRFTAHVVTEKHSLLDWLLGSIFETAKRSS